MVVSEARFDSIDGMIQTFMDLGEAPCDVELQWEGNQACLTITVYSSEEDQTPEPQSGTAGEQESDEVDMLALLTEDAEDYRLVLTEGKFTEATGFRIEDEGTVAILMEQDDDEIEEQIEENGSVLICSLTWTTADGD